MKQNRVVVTGLGVVAPNGGNVPAFNAALKAGKSGIRHVPQLGDYGFGCHVAGEAKPESLPDFFIKNRLETTSSFVQLACLAGVEAWEDAGFKVPAHDSDTVDWDTGILIGTGTPGVDVIADKLVPLTNSGNVRRIGGYGALNIMGSAPSAFLSSILATGNQSAGNSSACCTGLDALVEAFHRIRQGRAKRMLAGGTEGFSPHKWASLDAMRVLNRKYNDRPSEASRPMSASASGFVITSGAGVVVLEDLDTALERGATIYAEILGAEGNSGGQRNGGSLTFPNKNGVMHCLHTTLDMAGIKKAEIDLISGHLTATKADPFEFANWVEFMGDAPFPYINSTKSMIGHGLGAAGALESVACLLQLRDDYVHPSINCTDVHPEIVATGCADCIPQAAITNAGIRTIIKAGFGFGDVNSAIIFRKWA